MLLVDSIKQDIAKSLKKGDHIRLSTLRFLLSAIVNDAISKYGAQAEQSITDQDVLAIIKKQVKTRKESIEAFTNASRQDLADKEHRELEILQAFLPAELSDEELKALLFPLANSTEKNFGLLMNQAMKMVQEKADGGRVARILKSLQQS